MGNFMSTDCILDEETITNYCELTYLRKKEIRYIIKLLDDIKPGLLRVNPQHRFTIAEIDAILPQIRCNPFRDSIYRVFSSRKDNRMSLEDLLDLYSVFSENCPDNVRASWAFHIYDFDGDNQISLSDLMETVNRLTWSYQNEHSGIDVADVEHVARMVLQEMVFNDLTSISCEEFIRFTSRISEFSSTFHFKI
ncbi:PREDICTED: calcium and integrin-binding family member 3-like [Eufriesea mexicana]|uniref:calcium and integrin-binding family member 3-like n=1 Tax=Eufriesea mexicana TaxID=516756 RepID=UPI00083C3D7F|nr:PREDICTED: calcium and integrin-binding family member 3-like [Eufriesea mexicana]